MADREDAYQNIPFDRKYANLVDDIAEGAPEKQRDAVRQVLASESAQDTYKVLGKTMSPKEVKQVMIHGIEDFSQGKKISAGKYAAAITQELLEHDKYHAAAEGMLDRGIITKNQYNQLQRNIAKKTKEHARSLKSGLEALADKAAAAWILVAGGIIAMLASSSSISGAVIGTSSTPSTSFLIGFAAFIVGIVLMKNK